MDVSNEDAELFWDRFVMGAYQVATGQYTKAVCPTAGARSPAASQAAKDWWIAEHGALPGGAPIIGGTLPHVSIGDLRVIVAEDEDGPADGWSDL